MLLVIDFTDLNLKYGRTDIRLDDETDFTIKGLVTKICEGVEKFTGDNINNKNELVLLNPRKQELKNDSMLRSYDLSDWDTLYLVRRKR